MKTMKNFLLVLSTGYIFVYFSEHLFWARVRPDDSLLSWLGTWAAYSLLAYVFLGLVTFFRVKNIWSLFLVGAAFGWLAEGVVVQTTYEMLPLSISFTGLAWHALLTVWVGWYAVRKALLFSSTWSLIKLAGAIGVAYGLWAIFWWGEADGGVASIPEFASFTFLTSLLVILAYWLAGWSSSEPFVLNRRTVLGVATLFVLYLVFIVIPAAPLAALILPVLLGLVYWGLRRNRLDEVEGSLMEDLRGQASPWKYISLLTLPLTASGVYSLATTLHLQWHTGWVLYAITTPLGFFLFGVSLHKVLRMKKISSG